MDDETSTEERSLIGSWMVDDIGGDGVVADARPTMEFGADGRVAGTTGLNRFTGRFELVGEQLHTTPLATTRMAGPAAAMRQETRFLGALATPGSVTFESGAFTVGEGTNKLHCVRPDGDDVAGGLRAPPGSA